MRISLAALPAAREDCVEKLTDTARASYCSAAPSFAAIARGSAATPCLKEQSGGAPRRFSFAGRDFTAPRRTLPYWRSHSSRVGNAALRLNFSGSPAYTPETKGATRYSRISFPNFRRTKAATDSSSVGGCDFLNGSEAIFQREMGFRRVEASRAHGDMGIFRRWPCSST